ncbi:cupin domain-containing protein [Pararobbsia silviterrae]|uniref:Cupin domain-containing protein n=1 Tax=Pararobbsia silviterrae TaxID=1792498 RepID=A0A494XUQ2_9BURK|nr:cupin domain-containing protein [Pararobbsia silviterrae]RKP53574.1 cupin domain-containing protein [Pararobbsia silviterrae]
MTRQIRIVDLVADTANGPAQRREDLVPMTPGVDIELWQSFVSRAASVRGDVPFHPPSGQSLLRFFVLPAPPAAHEDVDWRVIADAFFRSNDIEACRVDGARHPLMHRTPTSDCVILLEGRVKLVLDEGEPIDIEPFDVVRQRATPHAWVNLGPGPALLISLMHGT